VPDTPTGGTDAPAQAVNAPAQAADAPDQAADAPDQAADAPSRAGAPGQAADSPERWRQVRAVLTANRQELSRLAAGLYPDLPRVGSTDLLTRAEWLPDAPLALGDLPLTWVDRPPAPVFDASGPASAHVRPARGEGRRYASYADAVGDLDRPGLFENRPSYRLLGADLTGRRELRLTRTSYFAGMELGHSVAHELAAAWAGSGSGSGSRTGSGAGAGAAVSLAGLPLRALAGDPCALDRRLALCAVTTLTLRRGAGGQASFVLHWRDPAKVNHAGGMYQVMPVGLFQPATAAAAAVLPDLDLWKCMVREFSEEFLGTSEEYQTVEGVLDYGHWPFYQRLTQARQAGRLAVYCLGAGTDPVTFATDILTVAVFDAAEFDAAFGGLVTLNAEGRVITGGHAEGIPFTGDTVTRLAGGGEPMQASGAALLQLAWQHRRHLFG
jgi:hypothetical protein